VTEGQQLLIANLLNGVAPETAGTAEGMTAEDALAFFAEVMRLVAEYRFVHCVPYFDCASLEQARRNRLWVLDILARIERWDSVEHDLILDLLKGRDVAEYGVEHEEIQKVLERVLDALPHYLKQESDRAIYFRSRKVFIAERRSAAIAAVEQFVSFRNPLTYKKIEHLGMTQDNALAVSAQVTH